MFYQANSGMIMFGSYAVAHIFILIRIANQAHAKTIIEKYIYI